MAKRYIFLICTCCLAGFALEAGLERPRDRAALPATRTPSPKKISGIDESFDKRLSECLRDDGAVVKFVQSLEYNELMTLTRLFPSLADAPARDTLLRTLVECLFERDRSAAETFVQSLQKPADVRSGRTALIYAFSRHDSDKAFAYIESLPSGPEQRQLFALAVALLARHDSGKAWEKLQTVSESEQRDRAIQSIVYAMAEKNIGAAAEFTSRLPRGRNQNQAAAALGTALARVDPYEARDFLIHNTTVTGPAFSQIRDSVLDTWIEKDPGSAMTWIGEIKNDGKKADFMLAALSKWAALNPSAAAAYLDQSTVYGQRPADEAMVASIGTQWSQVDGPKAVQWLEQFSPTATNETALSTAVSNWMSYDPEGALGNITAMPLNRNGDVARYTAAILLSADDPDRAVALAKQIGNDKARVAALSKIVGILQKTDHIGNKTGPRT